jgi:hypothetical protein
MRLTNVNVLFVLSGLFCVNGWPQQISFDWDLNYATVACYPVVNGQCQDFAAGPSWSLSESISALCNNGNRVAATAFIYASCSTDALGDVSGNTYSYPASVLTENGWIIRWIAGVDGNATGSSEISSWSGYDEEFCDLYRETYAPPDVPC